MGKVFGNLAAQFREFFKELTPIKKASIGLATIIAFVSGIVVLLMISGANYATLYKDLSPDQLPLIISKLEQKNIPYQIRSKGKYILVPDNLLDSARMVLMSELGSSGAGSLGLEIFDKNEFGTSSFVEKIRYQRAVQGELVRAINTIKSIKQSKVILAIPPKKTFLEDTNDTKASVVIEMFPGKSLAADQVKGITYLVANSVENLTSENVTIIDSRGKILSKSQSSASSAADDFFDAKQKQEAVYESRIEQILSKVVGEGKIIAKVNIKLNSKQVSSVEETVDPDRTAIRSSVVEEERLDGTRSNPTGVPGARSNLPGAEDNGNIGFRQNIKKEIKNTNYAVPKKVTETKEAAGGLEQISVAVLVDGYYKDVKGENGQINKEYVSRTAEELKKYKNIVSSAIGFSLNRGDVIKIENIQFKKTDFTEINDQLTNLRREKVVSMLVKWSLIGLSLLLVFLVIVRPFMRWITDSFQESVEDMLPRTIEELEELQAVDNSLPGMTTALPSLRESIDPDKAESELLKERILSILDTNQEKASGALSMWLVRRE